MVIMQTKEHKVVRNKKAKYVLYSLTSLKFTHKQKQCAKPSFWIVFVTSDGTSNLRMDGAQLLRSWASRRISWTTSALSAFILVHVSFW